MTALRLLLPGNAIVGDLSDGDSDVLGALADLYAYPSPVPAMGWVRATMVASLDGSATGPDGLSGSIGCLPDRIVLSILRCLADVVVVGAGTARAERYGPIKVMPPMTERRRRSGQGSTPPLALVTRSGELPQAPGLFGPSGSALVITCAAADVAGLRRRVGHDRVLVAGEDEVDPGIAIAHLAARGLRRVLVEGGPRLLGRTIAAGRLDELCLTYSPVLVAGAGPRIAVDDETTYLRLRAAHLVEADGLLLGRWLVQR